MLEVFCEPGDETWQRSDDDICQLVVDDLTRILHFIQPEEVIDAFAVRSRDAYPRYGLGYGAAVDTIKAHLASYMNLSLVGRGGTFRYNNSDHAIETGLLAARKALGEAVNIESVNGEAQYLEERRVTVGSNGNVGVAPGAAASTNL